MSVLRPIVLALVAVALIGCVGAAPSVGGGPTAAPVDSEAPSDGEAPAPGAPTAEEIATAIEVRTSFGLRSDKAWILAVAANPDATSEYGTPLLPAEVAEIERRATGDEALVGIVQAYLAEHADISGGLYIDQPRGGILTVLVTEAPDVHEGAISELLGEEGLVAVRQVRWTEQELMDLQQRIFDGRAFVEGIPARLTTGMTDTMRNVVQVTISSAVPDAGARIAEQFGAEQGQLEVISDGTGLLLQPTGTVEGRIIAPAGTDMTMLSPQYEADVDIGPREAVGIAVDPDGTFTIENLPPTTYRIYVLELLPAGNREAGEATVIVPPGGVASAEIVYEAAP